MLLSSALKRLLDKYSAASGQVKCHERYLGLPSLNCTKKRKLFNSIKERVWTKINGWKGKLLSIGGKEILLKAVVQFIPTFTMSLFQLPKSLVSELHKMCNRFWKTLFIGILNLLRQWSIPSGDAVMSLRNRVVHNLDVDVSVDVVVWASSFLEEWKSFQQFKRMISPSRMELVKWKPSRDGLWKINFDTASCYNNLTIGSGIVVRDMLGTVKVKASLKLQAMFSVLVAEAMAMHRGILLAIKSSRVPFEVESDSLQVVDLVNSGDPSHAYVGFIIRFILFHLEANTGCGVSHVSRNSNMVVDRLAKLAISSASDRRWIDCCPPWVELSVQLDASV
ncbi:hypothetical protein Ddye_000962 [Dipteronia dyeriana]|uniref:RNase H type-1 domain-containing protein n=1 Tax=Dipteronia dyeriana TaxID=168575 RepID=A0AAD9XN97_9ROSI|nr:hypothetical protein Ddye_000962 [Dipteronia dyeriana]